jgi:hypothetical protein
MKSRTGSKNPLKNDDSDSEDRTPTLEKNSTPPAQTLLNDHDMSAVYIRDKETGDWKVRNPAGSMGYNYLYRDDIDMD